MTYHRIAVCFISLFLITACHSSNQFMQRLMPSTKSQAPASLQPPPPPPPSPRAAQDQVSLPPQARSLKDTVLTPIENSEAVALLLPLTGQHAALGKDLENAAELALFDIKTPQIRILPLDTHGTPEGAIAAMNKAVAAHASIVLGPVFSPEAAAIAPIAKAHDIPVVTFSNNTDLAKNGVFVLGFMPQQQIKRVVEYAIDHGVHDYYMMMPDDAFGRATLETINTLHEQRELTLHIANSYNPTTNQGMVDAAQNIVKHIQDAQKREGIPKLRALIIPEGGSKLLEISKLISGFGLNANNIRLIGSGQWDDTTLGNYRRLYGGWFATASPTQRDIFEKHFEQTYHYHPVRIASIAYDAVALTCFLSQQSGNHFSTAAIINERGFAGVDGAFRFTPDHIAERALAVLEIIPNGFEILDEAPKVLKNTSSE